jgi:hypothetical protein
MKANYSFLTRKLRVWEGTRQWPSREEGDWEGWINVYPVQLGKKCFFLQIWDTELIEMVQRGVVEPISSLLISAIPQILEKLEDEENVQPVLALDLPGWRNPRKYPVEEWRDALLWQENLLRERKRKEIEKLLGLN